MTFIEAIKARLELGMSYGVRRPVDIKYMFIVMRGRLLRKFDTRDGTFWPLELGYDDTLADDWECCVMPEEEEDSPSYREGVLDAVRLIDETISNGESRPGHVTAAILERLLPDVGKKPINSCDTPSLSVFVVGLRVRHHNEYVRLIHAESFREAALKWAKETDHEGKKDWNPEKLTYGGWEVVECLKLR